MDDKIGVAVYCKACGLRKKPVGRSAPVALCNALCDHECDGYYGDPRPGSLWPGERASEFGYPCGDDATEPCIAGRE